MIMLMSIALILLAGMCAGQLFRKLSLPPLIGMILAGMLVGPYVLNLLDDSILAVSSQLRRIALIIILIRAGLKLNFEDLKKVGRPAVLMCFLPACFEMAGTILLAPFLLGVSLADAAVLGAVLAAVSPAVIVPHMIHIIDEGYGVEKGIPQMILAGASVDDVFVIVVFTSAVALALGNDVSFTSLLRIPVSIFTGVAAGLLIGKLFVRLVRITKMKTAYIVILMMSVAFLMNGFEDACNDMVPFASLLAIMTMGMAVRQDDIQVMKKAGPVFEEMWTAAEIFLFVLVGASVALNSLKDCGIQAVLLILLVLVFRVCGVWLCLLKTGLTFREKLFCMISYLPKATVQAAIGGLPLAMGVVSGQLILTVSVAAILLTAPLGAVGIEQTYRHYLSPSCTMETGDNET